MITDVKKPGQSDSQTHCNTKENQGKVTSTQHKRSMEWNRRPRNKIKPHSYIHVSLTKEPKTFTGEKKGSNKCCIENW
jgi:hypothetical protein